MLWLWGIKPFIVKKFRLSNYFLSPFGILHICTLISLRLYQPSQSIRTFNPLEISVQLELAIWQAVGGSMALVAYTVLWIVKPTIFLLVGVYLLAVPHYTWTSRTGNQQRRTAPLHTWPGPSTNRMARAPKWMLEPGQREQYTIISTAESLVISNYN